ncbi:MAG: hypothetical protein ABI461_20045 [Polyangiaceae bacterium]
MSSNLVLVPPPMPLAAPTAKKSSVPPPLPARASIKISPNPLPKFPTNPPSQSPFASSKARIATPITTKPGSKRARKTPATFGAEEARTIPNPVRDSSRSSESRAIARAEPKHLLASTSKDALPKHAYVYGDSTPFPHDIDFIRTLDDAVNCCVSLLEAETTIIEAQDAATGAEQLRQAEHVKLVDLANAVRNAILDERGVSGSTRVAKTGARLLEGTRSIVEGQMASLEAETQASVNKARKMIEAARAEVHLALEQFLATHDAPKTDIELCVVAGENGSAAVVTTTASFGFQASFDVPIPEGHAWREARRVREICENTVIAIPKQVGWFKKRMEPRPLKLDAYYVRSFVVRSDRGKITLSKRLTKPETCEIELDFRGETPRAFHRPVNELGQPGEAFELSPDDRTTALRLWSYITASSQGLKKIRRAMKLATFDGRPIAEVSPETLCRRLVSALGPIVRDIAERSGAEGELTLRKSVGTWERHENFITTDELANRTFGLPIPARRILDPLCQPFKARSQAPRALPAPSRPPMRSSSPRPLFAQAILAQEGAKKMFPTATASDSGLQPIDVPVSDISIVEVADDLIPIDLDSAI